MKRVALILSLLLSVSFVALYVVLPQLDTKQVVTQIDNLSRTAEEETEHEIKKDFKEKFYSLYDTGLVPRWSTITLTSSNYLAPLLQGFSSQPYIPPDFA